MDSALNALRYFNIATVSEKNTPWNTPVFFASDDACNLFWVSSKEALHSKNISGNPEVSITIDDSTQPEGVGRSIYIKGNACEVKEKSELEIGLRLLADKAGREPLSVVKVSESSLLRRYKATPKEAWRNMVEMRDGAFVDMRIPVDIKTLAEERGE